MLSTQRGQQTELACCEYLSRQGLKLIEKNYRCKLGEIDLIMQQRDTLVFVEVRYRKDQRFGGALYSIDHRKQRKIMATVHCYMQHKKVSSPIRIDVVAMSMRSDGSYTFDWICDAVRPD